MEFVIKQSLLKETLAHVQGVVERKSTIPVLSNILIESLGENSIRIVGTDLDVTIRCDAEAEIKTPGSMCVQARKLFELSRLLNGEDVRFRKEENEWVLVTCGRGRFRLAGVNKEHFPEIPILKSAPLKLPAAFFNYFIQHTAFAITNEQSRFTLSGAKFIFADGVAKMVTTDGHRLAYIERPLEAEKEGSMDVLIPKKALLELVKISRDSEGEVAFGEDQNNIYFEIDGRLLTSRKLSGTFPNYEMVMPKDNDKHAEFDLEDMRGAVRRVAIMADERNRSIRLTVREGEVEISAQSSEEGEGNEIVPADYAGEEIQLGFNWQYLQDFLNTVSSVQTGFSNDEGSEAVQKETDGDKVRVKESNSPTRIRFEFKDSNAQTLMKIAGESAYDYRYIVMPLRI
ncbi:MAG TPA: DNA polymerase III subunit beta [Pyrinomonadaceae bacterium]|nr:DNA polymerase III subunit beta [Pyrinomonadaceae bacterium]